MKINLQISENITQNFRKFPQSSVNFAAALIGTCEFECSKLSIYTALLIDDNNCDSLKESVEIFLPAGFQLVGFWIPDSGEEKFRKIIDSSLKNECIIWKCSVNDILTKCPNPGQFVINCFGPDATNDELQVSWVPVEELLQKTITLKLQYSLPLQFQIAEDATESENIEDDVKRAFALLESRFSLNPDYVINENLFFCKTNDSDNILLSESEQNCVLPNSLSATKTSCFDLWRSLQSDDRTSKRKDLNFAQVQNVFHSLKAKLHLEDMFEIIFYNLVIN